MVLLVRYGELALKSAYVRRQLEDRLAANVQAMFTANDAECIVKAVRGRLFVFADDEVAALRLLRRVFGIVSVSPATEVPSELKALTAEVVAYARTLLSSGDSFAIRARRSGQHPYTSQELARVLGSAIQDAIPGLAVDLDAPDREVHVEVRGPRAYIFHEVVSGPGGLPLGSQGEVRATTDDEAGLVAAWLVMRRGCHVRVRGREPFLAALRRWDPQLEVRSTPGGRGTELPTLVTSVAEASHGDPMVLQPLVGLTEAEIRDLAAGIMAA